MGARDLRPRWNMMLSRCLEGLKLAHNPSGALFQRPAEQVPTPRLQEVQSLTGRPDRLMEGL